MIRTVIADDEILVRMGLRTMINWEAYGYELVGEAGDGEKVLELCAQEQVDLVITDIKMPKLDGIALIRAIQERYPQTRIVVLSCYNDGEIIKEAMRYHGALDYIFKLELDRDELVKTLERVKTMMGCVPEKRMASGPSAADKEWYVECIRSGKTIDLPPCPLNIPLSEEFVCICLGILPLSRNASGKQAEDKRDSLKSWISYLLEQGKFTFDLLELQRSFYVCLMMEERVSKQLQDVCEKIIKTASLYWEFGVAAGVSQPNRGAPGLAQALRQAWEVFDSFFLDPVPGVRWAVDRQPADGKLPMVPQEVLRAALAEKDFSKAADAFCRFFEELRHSERYVPSRQIRESCFVQLSLLVHQAGGVPEESDEGLLQEVMGCACLTQLEQVVEKYLTKLQEAARQEQLVFVGKEVQKALAYIREHYREELTLREVAKVVGMNESYFSHLFKKSVRKSFITCLNEFRVEKARELIRTTDASLNVIAEQVGYGNYAYFSKVFKTVTGINANDYRNQCHLKIININQK